MPATPSSSTPVAGPNRAATAPGSSKAVRPAPPSPTQSSHTSPTARTSAPSHTTGPSCAFPTVLRCSSSIRATAASSK
ncbi:hypothetical protein ACFW9F_29020 [Streptomyces sp. NPDC059506]|uniref:hypothetical protein n=1 Tax=Streptomyces sp. NPDC059506 TaxID=3347751 RepID=UPI0036996820